MNIHTIDLHFQGLSENIAAYLVETSAGPVLVETGPHSTIDKLREGVAHVGFALEDIQHVFLTHIHLDHAGAAWWFAQQGARVYVHPRGYKHLAAPERLMASAKRIYQDKMDELWGQMNPIAEDRLEAVEDRVVFTIGDTAVVAHHTPGHAVHHIAWQMGSALFTGDVGGVSIRGGAVIPPCPPPDIDLVAWLQSLARIRELSPKQLYLTHFGPVDYSLAHLDELASRLQRWAEWMCPHFERGASIPEVTPAFQAMVEQDLLANGTPAEHIAKYEAANPSWMGAAGLLRYWKMTT